MTKTEPRAPGAEIDFFSSSSVTNQQANLPRNFYVCGYIYIFLSLSFSTCVLHSHYDWLMSTAETTASNSMFRNGSICAMKSVPGRTTQNNKLLYVYRKGGVIMKTVSFRSNSTIKDHDALECWVCQCRRYLALNVFSRRTATARSKMTTHESAGSAR